MSQLTRSFLILLALGLLAACGPPPLEDDILLATALPFAGPTPVPSPTLANAALPQTAEVDFFGTVAGFSYPADWTVYREANYVVAMPEVAAPTTSDGQASQQPSHPQVGVAVLLESGAAVGDPLAMAARAYFFTQDHTGGRFFTDYEQVMGVDRGEAEASGRTFTWGEHDAALFTDRLISSGTTFDSLHVAVQVRDNRFVVWWAAMYADGWQGFIPQALDMLSTATLDGVPLPAANLLPLAEDMLVAPTPE